MAKDIFDLIILKGPQEGKKLRFTNDSITIGRKFENTVVINSPTVSGENSRLFLENDHYYIEDLDSVNGTYVNNERIEGKKRVFSGDKIEMGSALLLFMRKGEDPGQRPFDDSPVEMMEAGHSTIVLGENVQNLEQLKAARKKKVPKVYNNPLVLILLLLIIAVGGFSYYLYNQPVQKSNPKKNQTTTQTAEAETKVEIELPRLDRGEMTTSEVLQKAEDFYNKGKQKFNGRKLKDENLFLAINDLKYAAAYLALTDEKPAYNDDVRSLLENAITELDNEYKEFLFLARKLSRQENYKDAFKNYEKIRLLIPDEKDERYIEADKAIKYLVSRNLVK